MRRFADRLERPGGGAGVATGELFTGIGLDHHQAHRVGDDVVQLAGYPGAFVAHRLLGEDLAFGFDLAGASLELLGQVPPGGHDQAAHPGPGGCHLYERVEPPAWQSPAQRSKVPGRAVTVSTGRTNRGRRRQGTKQRNR